MNYGITQSKQTPMWIRNHLVMGLG